MIFFGRESWVGVDLVTKRSIYSLEERIYLRRCHRFVVVRCNFFCAEGWKAFSGSPWFHCMDVLG